MENERLPFRQALFHVERTSVLTSFAFFQNVLRMCAQLRIIKSDLLVTKGAMQSGQVGKSLRKD